MKISEDTRRFLDAYRNSGAPPDFVERYCESPTDLKEKVSWLAWGAANRDVKIAVECARCVFGLIAELELRSLQRRLRLTIARRIRSMRHRATAKRARMWFDVSLVRLGCRRAGKAIARDHAMSNSTLQVAIFFVLREACTKWSHASLLHIASNRPLVAGQLDAALLAAYAGCKRGVEIAIAELNRPSVRPVMRLNVGVALIIIGESRGYQLVEESMAMSRQNDKRIFACTYRDFRARLRKRHMAVAQKIEEWLSSASG